MDNARIKLLVLNCEVKEIIYFAFLTKLFTYRSKQQQQPMRFIEISRKISHKMYNWRAFTLFNFIFSQQSLTLFINLKQRVHKIEYVQLF